MVLVVFEEVRLVSEKVLEIIKDVLVVPEESLGVPYCKLFCWSQGWFYGSCWW